jgi:hypothetical protein
MTGQKQSYKHAIRKRRWCPFAHLRSIGLQWNLQDSCRMTRCHFCKPIDRHFRNGRRGIPV